MTNTDQLARRARRFGVSAVVVALLTLATALAPSAVASDRGDHCFTDTGGDFNAVFGVSEQIVNRFCLEATAGEQWRTMLLWIVSPEDGAIYPDGYTPLHASPSADFAAKVASVKVIVDGGTRQERTYVFSGADAVRTGFTFDQFEPDAPPLPTVAILTPALHPLRKGDHTRELVFTLSAEHCDGLDVTRDLNCFPAGEITLFPRPLTVTTPSGN